MPEPANPSEKRRELAREAWLGYLTGNHEWLNSNWRIRFMKRLPSDPRCKVCGAPFQGVGRPLLPALGMPFTKRSAMNPTLCNQCEVLVTTHEVGAEVELTLLFADVRGSTELAERVGPTEFQRQIDRFYRAATDALVRSAALVDKLVGDEVIALYVPGVAGEQHQRRAIDAALELLRVTGHGSVEGPWLPIGAGVHTGVAWIGAVGSSTALNQLTVLGDAANTAARLASAAGAGEVLVTFDAWEGSGTEAVERDTRTLELRGKQQPVSVKVLRAD